MPSRRSPHASRSAVAPGQSIDIVAEIIGSTSGSPEILNLEITSDDDEELRHQGHLSRTTRRARKYIATITIPEDWKPSNCEARITVPNDDIWFLVPFIVVAPEFFQSVEFFKGGLGQRDAVFAAIEAGRATEAASFCPNVAGSSKIAAPQKRGFSH